MAGVDRNLLKVSSMSFAEVSFHLTFVDDQVVSGLAISALLPGAREQETGDGVLISQLCPR